MIVITAPTGQIGRQLINNLLDGGEQLRLIARDPSRLPDTVRQRVEVVPGSHGDPEVVDRAFAGADAVFWLYPSDPAAPDARAAMLDFTRPAADAIARHGVEHVVSVSAVGRGAAERAGLLSLSWEMDDVIMKTGVAFRELAMPTFMDNLLWQVESIARQGVFAQPAPQAGDRPVPLVATRDIAAVAAELLTDRSWSGQEVRAVLGPQDLTFADQAMIMSEVLRRPIRFQPLTLDQYRSQLIDSGFSDSMADAMVEMAVAKNDGIDTSEPRSALTRTPTTFRRWCAEVLKPAAPIPELPDRR